ncbi:helix-turn-helix domain-containing protein [Clostridium uliginosum]|uniref:Cupin domain protein n=1 Tax=Clostridium uliginosum TaxID=119641 RepID=A0A1I1IMS8_9CLOT|nr:XRE family transcriptional regulator [Clostridium uliginosum]SFC37537.1 Cupin domain protein [Clostridium uliginosum]
MTNYSLGNTILEYRKSRGYSIREFAEVSGISTSLISQLERGIANPSLQVLKLISKALNVPLFTLFINDIDHESLILRKEDRKKIYRSDNEHIVYDILTPDFMKANVEILMMNLNNKSQTTESHYKHNKEELAIVMKGTVYAVLEDQEYILNEGDVIRIPPYMKHKFKNKTNQMSNVLFVLTSPSYNP